MGEHFAECWSIEWFIRHDPASKVSGNLYMSTEDLLNAFALGSGSGRSGQELIDRFGASAAAQGKYIRWDMYLNIPGPGTGNDDDPNLSIDLDEEIQEAVRLILV